MTDTTKPTIEPADSLPSKAIQITTTYVHPAYNNGGHVQLFALCEDGSIWMQFSMGYGANVPEDGKWYPVEQGRNTQNTRRTDEDLLSAALNVVAWDWSDNDEDCVRDMDKLREVSHRLEEESNV